MDRTLELIKLAKSGDQLAIETLVEENIGLVWSIVKKFLGRGYEGEDLFQIGSIGLLKCIQKFDDAYEVKFSTYAVPMIMGEIKRFLRDDGMIKVSRPLKEMAIKAKYKQEELMQKTGKTPTISEIATALEVDAEDLVMAMEAGREVESLYSTIYQGDGSPIYLIDKLDQKPAETKDITDIIALKEIISKLNEKEQKIIMLRYFEEKTQTEVAKEIGVSQVQVSRIEKKVLKNLRESLC